MKRLSVLIGACALCATTAAANAVPFVLTLQQVGSNVVATSNGGSISLDGRAIKKEVETRRYSF